MVSFESRYVQRVTYSATSRPEGLDVNGGSNDVNNTAVVGKLVLGVVDVRSSDGASRRLRSGRVLASVIVLVTSGGSDKYAAVGKGLDGIVGGLVVATTQAQVDDNTVGAVAVGRVAGNKVKTRDDTRVGTSATTGVAVIEENLDTEDVDALGDTVGVGANGAGNVGAVTAVVVVDGDERLDILSATTKVLL